MKQVFHKIISLVMAFVVLFSTMSFTVDMHYCGDTLIDTAVLSKAKTCGMEMENTNSDHTIIKKNCCTEKQINIKGQNELKVPFDNFSFSQQLFFASFIYSYNNLFEGLDNNVSSYEDYEPPLVIKQIYKFDETYLI